MLNISDASKAIYLDGNIAKTVTISFPNANVTMTNSDIIRESLELTEAIENDSEIAFQGCIASQLKFQCADIITDLRGEYVEAKLSATGAEDIPLFKGYVDSQTNRTYEDVVTEFTCYDAIYRKGSIDVTSWYNGLAFPMTVKAFRDSFFSYIGITQQSRTLINDNQRINKVVTDNQILALDVMRAICQVNAVYGQIGRDGKFKYIELLEIVRGLYPQETLYPSPDLYPSRENAGAEFDRDGYIDASYEPFAVNKINRVDIIGFNGTRIGSYGSGTNIFTIADNIVAQGCITPAQLAKNITEKLYMITYIPSYVKVPGLPWVECGDIYLFNTYKNIIRAYVFNRTIKGIQTLFDEYTSDGVQTRTPYKESAQTQTTSNETGIQENAEDIVEAKQLTVDMVNAETIRTNNLVANEIQAEKTRTNTLVANEIQAEVTRSNQVIASSVQAEATRTNTLVANEIRATKLYADSVGSEAERVSKIYADNVSANAIRTSELYADSIGSEAERVSKIYADNVSASALSVANAYTDRLTADKATISQLNSVTISASQITSGTISADRITANTVIGKLAGNTVSCGYISAGGGGFGKITCSAGSTCGGKDIATSSDIQYCLNSIQATENSIKNWCNSTFQKKS